MKLKGIALSIETVVLIVLAAIVVTVLLAFLMGVINPADNEIKFLQKQQRACGEIVQIDPQCGVNRDGNVDPRISEVVSDQLMAGNPPPCSDERPSCNPTGSGSDVLNCLRSCCRTFCGIN